MLSGAGTGAGFARRYLADMHEFNQQVIDEFRANEGKLGGGFAGAPVLLLHTTGANSGKERVNPLAYQADGYRYVVFASKGAAPTNPDWFHNLRANPRVTVEVGDETFPATARVAEGEEHERLWSRQKELMPGFAEYETKTTRVIPVVVLERSAN
jgi:deazaflavin-dependent oxidoreductase (nitroreductase family)